MSEYQFVKGGKEVIRMFGYENWRSTILGPGTCSYSYGWWTLCLVVMMLVMGLCFFFTMSMMRIRKGNMMCYLPLFRKAEVIDHSASDSARDILDRRYASGEISSEEYEEKIRNLNRT